MATISAINIAVISDITITVISVINIAVLSNINVAVISGSDIAPTINFHHTKRGAGLNQKENCTWPTLKTSSQLTYQYFNSFLEFKRLRLG